MKGQQPAIFRALMAGQHVPDVSFQRIIENAGEAIIIVDAADGRIVYVNEITCSQRGYTRDDMLGMKLNDLIQTDTLQSQSGWDQYVERVKTSPRPFMAQSVHRRKDGSIFPVDVAVSYETIDGRGYLIGFPRDITKRRYFDIALEKRYEFERLVTGIATRFINLDVDKIDEGISEALRSIGEFAEVDQSFVLRLNNETRSFTRTHRWERPPFQKNPRPYSDVPFSVFPWFFETIRTNDVISVLSTRDLPPEAAETKDALETHGLHSLLVVAIRLENNIESVIGFTCATERAYWSEDLVVLLRIVGEIFVNVLKRHEAREAIVSGENRFRALVEHSSDMIGVLDHNGIVQFVSETVERVLGYHAKELIGTLAFDYVHSDDVSNVKRVFAEGMKNPGTTMSVEYRVKRKDGEWAVFESIGTNRLHDANVRGFVLNSRDISVRRAAETKLREAEKMRTVGQLAAGVTHNINNALTAILGYVQIIQRDLGSKHKTREALRIIERIAKGAASTVRRIQSFAHAGDRIEFVPVDINELVNDAVQMTRPAWERANPIAQITLNVHLEREPMTIYGNPSDIRDILVNLMLNAVQAMPGMGELVVTSERSESHALVHVRDTGSGIPNEAREHIFEPFFTTKGERGSGLGLSVSYGIAQRHSGEITVVHHGCGTTFTLKLPIYQPESVLAGSGGAK